MPDLTLVDRPNRGVEQTRSSLALRQFFDSMRDCQGLEILDLGEFNQANRDFVHSLGHRLLNDDITARIDAIFGPGDPSAVQRQPDLAHQFLSQSLQWDPGQFDAVFLWDTLQYASRPLLDAVVARLHSLLRSRGMLLAFFHSDVRAAKVQSYSFRINDEDALELYPRSMRRPAQLFTNRAIEKTFERFSSIKFYLTRDSLREVLIRR